MLFLQYCFITLFSLLHPFHVSVCSIHYAGEEESLQITMKIFADDLEEALNKAPYRLDEEPYIDVLNPQDPQVIDAKVEQYIRKHFELTVNGEITEPVFLGYELEDLAMWCYLEVTGIKKVDTIKIHNSILTTSFDDQVNIVHVDYQDAIKSMKLAGNKLTDEVKF